jgi:hypothetical protein
VNVEELFAATLLGNYDDDEPWRAVQELHEIGSHEVLEKASGWCRSQDPIKRARGADVLAQLGRTAEQSTNNYADECFAVVAELAANEQHILPLDSAIHALGHIGDARAVPLVVKHVAHSDSDVRFAVAFASGNFPTNQLAIDALLSLIGDEDADVRDWSAFALGTLSDADSPGLREALANALDDPDGDVLREAAVGLARRGDLRALTTVISMLRQNEVDPLAVEAASWLLGYAGNSPDWQPSKFVIALNDRFGTAA